VDTENTAHRLLVFDGQSAVVALQRTETVYQIVTVSIASCQEEDAHQVGVARVHRLQNLLEGVLGVALPNRAACDEVGKPERVEGTKLLDLESLMEPLLPVVEVLVIDHVAHALRTQ